MSGAVGNIDPNKLSSSDINAFTTDEIDEILHTSADDLFVLNNKGQRFALHPAYRLPLMISMTGVIGGLQGAISGYRKAGLQYLASNSHRLPTTRNGWYYYHRRKNYVCMSKSFQNAAKQGTKLSLMVGSVFGLEAALDHMRNCIDFANTAMSLATTGWVYAWYHNFTKVATGALVKKGFITGAAMGLVQDGLQLLKGDDVWYMRQFFGILPRDVAEKPRLSA